MMKQIKHLLLLTLLSLCSVTSQAYEVTVNMIKYKTDSGDKTAYVSGYTYGITEAKIRSSITYNGKQIPVTSIGKRAFSGCSSLTSVIIPNSVTSIGDYAFENCSSLTSVEYNAVDCEESSFGKLWFEDCPLTSLKIGNEVKSIPDYLAYGQSKLTSVTIPNSVTYIGGGAFEGCTSLTSFEYNAVDCKGPSPNSDAWFKDCPLTSLKIGNEVKSIPAYLAYGQSKLTSVTIPNSVTSIGKMAFEHSPYFTSITIPNSVTSIGWHAFCSCM